MLSTQKLLQKSYTVFWPNSNIAFIRGVTVHVFLLNVWHGTRVPNKSSIVLTTARVELLWKLTVLYILLLLIRNKDSPFKLCQFFFQEIQTMQFWHSLM